MTYVVKHKPTGLFIGDDEDHCGIDDATQYETLEDAKYRIPFLVNPDDEFEVVENLGSAEIRDIEDHMAYLCECGSTKFNLIKSGKIECAQCGSVGLFLEWKHSTER